MGAKEFLDFRAGVLKKYDLDPNVTASAAPVQFVGKEQKEDGGTSSPGVSSFLKDRDRILGKYNQEYVERGNKNVKNWADRYNQIMDGIQGYRPGNGDQYLKDIQSLIGDYNGIKSYTDNSLRDYWKNLLDLQKTIYDAERVRGQFDSDEAYYQYINDQAVYQEIFGEYDKFRSSGDFQETAKKGMDSYGASVQEQEEQKNPQKSFRGTFWDALAGAGSQPGMHAMEKASFDLATDTSFQEPTDRWSEDEKAMYGYLYETDREMADSYGLAVNDYYNQIERRQQEEQTAEFGKNHKILSTAGGVMGNALGFGTADYLANQIEAIARGTITEKDYVTPFQALGNATGAVGQDLNEKYGTIREDIPVVGGRGWGDAYQIANSFLTSTMTAHTVGPLGTSAIFFGNAASDTMYDALDRGATDEQAIALGLTAGAAEALGEYCSVSHLLKLEDAGVLNNFFLEMLKQGTIEGEEEVFTSILNLFSDRVIMGDKSELKTLMAQYMQENPEADEEEAKKYALKKIANDVAFDFLGGFVSGEMGGFTGAGINAAKWNNQYHNIYSGVQQELYDNAAKLDPNNKAVQDAGKRLADGKSLRDSQVRKLIDLNQRSTIEQAVQQRLNEVGESGNVDAVARAITKQALGEGLSLSDQAALKGSSMGDMVLREAQNGEIYERTGRTVWVDPGLKAVLENTSRRSKETPGQKKDSTDTQQAIHNLEGKEVDATVSEDGKTRIVSTGQETEIQKIASVRDGNITFQMEDGSLADAGDIAYGSEGDAIIYDAVASLGVGPEMANLLVDGFTTSRDVPAAVYAKGMQDAFRYGKWGAPQQQMESGAFTSQLTEHQRQQAYEIGRMTAREEARAKQKQKKQAAAQKNGQKEPGKVHFEGDETKLTKKQKTNIQALETIAEALGVQIYVFESETAPAADGKGTVRIGDNGWYVPEDGSIHIDLYAGADGKGTMLFTAAHELTHFIKDQSPEKFQALADFLMEQYGKKGVPVQALVENQMAKARKHNLDLDYDGAFEEVVADSMESMLTDGKVLQELKQRDKGLWQKVKDYVLELCEKIRKVYKRLKPDSLEGRMVAEMRDAAEEMRRLFTEGLVDAGENFTGGEGQKNTTREGGVKMQIREIGNSGKFYVQADRQVLTGTDPKAWGEQIANYINENIRKEQDVAIPTADGHVLLLTGRSAYKLSDQHVASIEKKIRNLLPDDAYARKGRAVTHIDELIQVAKFREYKSDLNQKHENDIGEDGFNYYEANFKDFDGKYYRIRFSAGINANEETVYSVGQIRERRFPADGGSSSNEVLKNGKKPSSDAIIYTSEGKSQVKNAIMQAYEKALEKKNSEAKKKFSLRDQDVRKMNDVLEKQNEKLREDVASLKELLKLQKSVTGGKLLNQNSLDTAAGHLMRSSGAKGNKAEFSTLLKDVYSYIAGDEAVSWEGIMEKASKAADWIQAHTETKQQLDPYGAEVLSQLRGSRISLDESQRAEAEYQFGSVNAFRKQLFGTVTITDKDSVSLDSKWAELSQMYPDVFDPNTSASDMPGALLDAIDSLKNMGISDMWYDKEAARQDLLQQIYDSYWRVSTLHTVADVKQKQIDRLKGEHIDRLNKIKAQNQENIQKLKSEHRADMKKLREDMRKSSLEKQAEIRKQYQDSRAKSVEGRNRTQMRHNVQRVVKDLNDLLLNGTKERHVPIELQKAVAEALDAVNMDTVGVEERVANLQEALTKTKDPKKIQEIARKIENIQKMGSNMQERLQRLKAGYEAIMQSEDPLIANAYSPEISGQLMTLAAVAGDTPLRDMNLKQLEAVYNAYTMVLTTIRNANKTFKAARNATVQELSQKVMGEVRATGGNRKYSTPAMEAIRKFGWNNLKPVYAFELMGSKTFSEIFKNVRKGEDIWAVDVNEARDFYLEQVKKYGYNQWDMGKQYEFTATTGAKFQLGLPQIMSLYAYSRREQAADHLRKGGIVIDESTEVSVKTKLGVTMKFNPTEATAYNISDETLMEIVGKLTEEQKAYVEAMQEYLSTVMGEKGNEISLQMYGIKLFGEKNYFPLRSAQQYMARAKEQQQGDRKIKNAGFSKQTVQHAGNPVVLSGFMDVWAEHVNEMSMYHAFVLPMEDFYRVFNYNTGNVEAEESRSVNAAIQNAYGNAATKYIDQLLKDLNGGVRADPTTGIISRGMNLFKKGAVFASASVVIQQPSAIGRAFSMIDVKYFAGPRIHKQNHQNSWQEVKKYAPVAAIKEMGYFDTNMGKSTKDYILGQEYEGFGEKAKAFFVDSDYRDEALSRGAALADEITWCNIWEAVKRETKAKHPDLSVKSEAFLQMAGERFTDVIVKTQVYDSVLSRSGNMRSKDTGMKMATAFMAEPTTSINMITDALVKGKRNGAEGRRYCRKVIGAVMSAQVINSILVSFVYAARDNDEDETYLEKYLESLVGGLTDSLNPATYIPFLKDIMSIVQGYDVERSDLAVVSDLWKAWKQLGSKNLTPWRKVEGFVGSLCQMFGLPVKNIMRDARGCYQMLESIIGPEKNTLAGAGYAIKEGIGEKTSIWEQMYDAYADGDEEHLNRVLDRYMRNSDAANEQQAEKSMKSGFKNYLKDQYVAGKLTSQEVKDALTGYLELDSGEADGILNQWQGIADTGNTVDDEKKGYLCGEISGEEYVDYLTKYAGKSREEAEAAEKKLRCERDEGFAYSDLREMYTEGKITKEKASECLQAYGGYSKEDAAQYMDKLEFEKEYGFAYSDRKQAYLDGKVSGDELQKILVKKGGYTVEEAAAQVEVYEWEKLGLENVTASRVEKYNTYCKPAGVSKEAYMRIVTFSANTHNDVDENGKTINYSAVQKVMAEINRLNVSDAQKTAIARSMGWKEKTINKYKLW